MISSIPCEWCLNVDLVAMLRHYCSDLALQRILNLHCSSDAIANELRETGKEVLFIVVPDLLDHLRSSFAPEARISYDALFEKIKKMPILVLDDFGEHSATPWAQEKIYQLINYRYNARLATVMTTCLNLEEIENRVSSRMVDPSISLVFNIIAPDYRGDIKTTRPVRSRPKAKN